MDDGRGDFLDDLKDVKDSMNVSAVLEVINNKAERAKPLATPREPQPRNTETKPSSKPTQIATRSKHSAELTRPGLQNLTTRLSPDTTLLLKRMVLQQQLKNQKPDTRQDLIEVALREWARRHGYLRDNKVVELPSEEAQGGD